MEEEPREGKIYVKQIVYINTFQMLLFYSILAYEQILSLEGTCLCSNSIKGETLSFELAEEVKK